LPAVGAWLRSACGAVYDLAFHELPSWGTRQGPCSRAGGNEPRRLRTSQVGGSGSRGAPTCEAHAKERIDLLLDVGAHIGQYCQRTRGAGFAGRIVSFEPLADAYQRLAGVAVEGPAWDTRRLALGEEDGVARVNLAANSWSRSLLPMGERHLQAGPSGVRAHRGGANCATRHDLGRGGRRL